MGRDDAYLEFAEAAFAVGERQRLAELRSLAREERTNAALRLGQDGELIAELETRVRVEPYRERGWEQRILSLLYRSGRQADALATYRRARARLVEDLGVEPGDALQSLEQGILAHDPDLTAGRPSPVVVAAARVTGVLANPYRGLARYEERDAGLFVARQRPVAEIAGRLAEHDLVVVTGASGVGKSSVVRAGLLPALRTGALPGSSAWRWSVLTPDHVLAHLSERPADRLVVDQVEELFTLYDRARKGRGRTGPRPIPGRRRPGGAGGPR